MQVQIISELPELLSSPTIARIIDDSVVEKEWEASNDIACEEQLQIEDSFRRCFEANPNDMCSEIVEPIIVKFEEDGYNCSNIWKMYREKLARSRDWTKEEALERHNVRPRVIREITRI